ncbi:MAG: 3-ketosteroid dehydrogenase [Nocardioides sp.]|nr:3-ketosteroid dehydrogenase [Nocardioides sp.]
MNLVGQDVDRLDPVLVVGGGLSGVATALGVAARGRRAVVLEAADLLGGAAAYSAGQVWCGANHVMRREGRQDDLGLVERYVRGIAHDRPDLLDEPTMRRWLTAAPEALEHWETLGAVQWEVIQGLADYHDEADGALSCGRYVTSAPFEGSRLGPWRERLRVSPYFPVGSTYAELFERGRRRSHVGDGAVADHAGVPAFGSPESRRDGVLSSDLLTFGTGLFASFLARAVEMQGLEVRTGARVRELLVEAGRVVGVEIDGAAGRERLRGPVVLATSGYDWDPKLVRELLDLGEDDFGSVAPRSLAGDGIALARQVGGDVVAFPSTSVPALPGWPAADGDGFSYGPEYALPHSIIVDATGRRFCDDSYWVDIVAKVLAPGDRHLPFYLVWDERHHQQYGLGRTAPGEDYPSFVESAGTLEDLASRLGIPAEGLSATVRRFNEHADDGVDPDFGRGSVEFVKRFAGDPAHEPNPLLGSVASAPFHGTRLRLVGTGIGTSGVRADPDGRVLDQAGHVLPGLYAVGSCVAHTTFGTGYNSGFALGRGLTLAYLVSHELAPGPLDRAES